jgi:hypothetical protein
VGRLVQERGTYFLAERDPKYVDSYEPQIPFLEPGWKTGALVEAQYGKGGGLFGPRTVASIAAGTDGAYTLLANLLSWEAAKDEHRWKEVVAFRRNTLPAFSTPPSRREDVISRPV